jgi:radical SAM protein with 4Fe4S-binding SPASM domain
MELENHNIFTIPVGHYFDKRKNNFHLVYAPLSGNMMLADEKSVHKMKQVFQRTIEDEEVEDVLQTLTDTSETAIETIRHLEDYRVLYILPNFICNFSCSYCYSAKGRSNKELSLQHLKAVLDYFIDAKRCNQEPLKITFVGGGEPMISWNLVKYGLEYASSLADKQGIELYFGLITNGSVINEEILEVLSYHRVTPRISFEILKDIQNKQRGHYDKVCETISKMLNAGINCEVRSMITPDNVHQLEEMVQEMINRFPAMNRYYFDPIIDANTFHDIEFTRNFYHTYRHSFMRARRLATANGKEVRNAVSRSLETVVERYCNGEFCLTPEGTLSICMEVSSPHEKEYEKHVYGHIDENNILQINKDKFYFLKEKEMAGNNPKCAFCFVKWNCGGGCMANNNQYPQEILGVICEATRELTLELLLDKLNEEQLESSGISLKELVDTFTE